MPSSTIHSTTSHHRWTALSRRDPSAKFLYAVLTTRIYCRPSCPARLARRANIIFFETVSAAESAGFRACKRCKPALLAADIEAAAAAAAVVVTAEEMVKKVCAAVEERQDGKVRLQELARLVGVSVGHLCRLFKREMGCTVGGYGRMVRERNVRGEKRDEVGFVDWGGFDFGVDFGVDFGFADGTVDGLVDGLLVDGEGGWGEMEMEGLVDDWEGMACG